MLAQIDSTDCGLNFILMAEGLNSTAKVVEILYNTVHGATSDFAKNRVSSWHSLRMGYAFFTGALFAGEVVEQIRGAGLKGD
jgi:hypothetical protein